MVLKTLRINFKKNGKTFIISKNKSSIKRDFIKVAFGINSAAIDSFKKWPFEKFVQLTKMILHKYKNLEIYLYGSPEEYSYSQRLLDEVQSSKVYNYCGKFNIVDSLYSIADCDLTIANCNAISHMSCLVDVNTIGIYGPTDPFITAPISRKLFPIISKEICIESCKNYSTMYMAKPNCILAISVQDVFDKFNNIILKNFKTVY